MVAHRRFELRLLAALAVRPLPHSCGLIRGVPYVDPPLEHPGPNPSPLVEMFRKPVPHVVPVMEGYSEQWGE